MKYHLSRKAIGDIADLLDWSDEHFGAEAQQRYEALVDQAIRDIAADPYRSLSKDRPELGEGLRTWHLRNSRDHAVGDKVKEPRHFLLYRVMGDEVQIGRVPHARKDLPGQVTDDMWT